MKPLQTSHVGTVPCRGLWLDSSLVSETVMRARIVSRWEPGTTVHTIGDGWIVRWPVIHRVRADRALGVPLVERQFGAMTLLCAAPLEDNELEGLDDGVALVIGGTVQGFAIEDKDVVDVAAWLDVGPVERVEVTPLGEAIPPPTIDDHPDGREVFDPIVGEPLRKMMKVRRALQRGRAKRAGGSAFERFLSGVRSFFQALRPRGRALAVVPDDAPKSSWLDRFAANVRTLFLRALLRARLAQMFARRQAEYLTNMLEMFERGDFEEALRHAIPLGGDGEQAPPLLGVPKARRDLLIRPGTGRASGALLVDVHETLRAAYRRAFEFLVKAGRIEEAAFVLAELLRADEEAVSFLEEHGKLELAAQIAEARELPAGLVVRQWFVAGNVSRAVQIARMRSAFSDAVDRLERANRNEDARALRMLWASSLAEKGDYVTAVTVAWPVEGARALVKKWIELAIAQGGEAGAFMLGRRLELEQMSVDEARTSVLGVLMDRSDEGPQRRIAFARAIADIRTSAKSVFARATVRALYADAPRAGVEPAIALLQWGDGALRADRAPFPAQPVRMFVDRPRVIRDADRGVTVAKDAAWIGGKLLVALGELGARVISRDGRTVAAHLEPAERLIASDIGDRVISVARRGEATRLARIDLTRRLCARWLDARIESFASTFDGWNWIVAAKDELWILDATRDDLKVVHRVGDMGRILAISRSPTSCSIAAVIDDALEHFRFDLPSWTLRARRELDVRDPLVGVTPSSDGSIALVFAPKSSGQYIEYTSSDPGKITIITPEADAIQVVLGRHHLAAVTTTAGIPTLCIGGRGEPVVRAALVLCGAHRVQVRETADGMFLAFDDCARAFVVDPVSGECVAEWRLP